MRAVTCAQRLHQLAETRPDDTFVVDGSAAAIVEHTFADLDRLVGGTAMVLRSLGVGTGTAVHLQLRNSVDFLACLFAVNRLGGFVVPTSPASTVDDLAYITSHAECAVSVVDRAHVEVVLAAHEMAPEIRHVVVADADSHAAPDGVLSLHRLRDEAGAGGRAADAGFADSGSDDLAAVLYTSGTTGWPKGVMLTNGNLLFAGEAMAAHARVRPDDRWLLTLPLFHLNALGYSLMSGLCTGASVALVDHFDAAAWHDDVCRLSATLSSLFSVHVRQLLRVDPTPGGSPLRLFFFAQHLTTSERTEIERRFGAPALQVYGMTETIAPTIADVPYGERRIDTIGHATPWAVVKLVDRRGRAVEPGGEGELLVRGEPGRSLMAGYFKRPDETALVLRDGWLRTGDRMLQEADGGFRFLGRAVDLIKPGVDNVSAPEIERVLLEHLSVVDAAVVGAHGRAGDEEIVAFVVLDPGDDATAEELLAWSRERLADYKVPRRIVAIAELPRNQLGKVLKGELQRLAANG